MPVTSSRFLAVDNQLKLGPQNGPVFGNRNILFICYEFPPVGGAGVQRMSKFAKYLPQFGWTPAILTASNPSVPVRDESLCRDVPTFVQVHRTKTWEPGYSVKASLSHSRAGGPSRRVGTQLKRIAKGAAKCLLQPDPQILWTPTAKRAGRNLLRTGRFDAILATGPPFSSLLLGVSLSRSSGLPLIVDFRDEWGISNKHRENRGFGKVSLILQNQMQARVLRGARIVLATTQASADSLRQACADVGSSASVHCIYNGYDPDDFVETSVPVEDESSDTVRLVYIGTLWRLTTCEPLVRAVEKFGSVGPDQLSRLEIVFIGRRTTEQDELVARLKRTRCKVVEHFYVDHATAVAEMRKADALCLILADTPESYRVVPAKLFEYMRASRPILAIAPPGEVWSLLKAHPDASCFSPTDLDGLRQWLQRLLSVPAQKVRTSLTPSNHWCPEAYARPAQASELAGILDTVTCGRSPSQPIC